MSDTEGMAEEAGEAESILEDGPGFLDEEGNIVETPATPEMLSAYATFLQGFYIEAERRQAFFPAAHLLIWTYFVDLHKKFILGASADRFGHNHRHLRTYGLASSHISRSACAIFSKQATGHSLNWSTRVSRLTRSEIRFVLASTHILAKHCWKLYSIWRTSALQKRRRSSEGSILVNRVTCIENKLG